MIQYVVGAVQLPTPIPWKANQGWMSYPWEEA